MFDHTSRYDKLPTLQIERDGRVVKYVSRRFRPSPSELPTLVEVRLSDGMRLDSIAATTLGQPELYWQICDANDDLNPFDLMDRVGQVLKVPMPGRQGS
jgi:hypothetical protein